MGPRQVYRLLGVARRYGAGPVDIACQRALDLDVVSITKMASMLEQATEGTAPPRPVRQQPGRVPDPGRTAVAHARREDGQPATATMAGQLLPYLRTCRIPRNCDIKIRAK
jgi:hypothetical protein